MSDVTKFWLSGAVLGIVGIPTRLFLDKSKRHSLLCSLQGDSPDEGKKGDQYFQFSVTPSLRELRLESRAGT